MRGISAHVGFNTDSAYAPYGHVVLGLPVMPSPML